MPHLRIHSALFLLVFSATPALAQTPPVDASIAPGPIAPDPDAAKKKKALEASARQLVEELIENGRAFRLPENQCLALFKAADLLWKTDEKRARELYREAMQLVLELQRQPEDEADGSSEQNQWQILNLRQQLLQSLSQRDAQLALEFLEASRIPDDKRPPGSNQQEAFLELSLAQQIAAKDPKRAFARAEKYLADGEPVSLLWPLLMSLREKDLDAAQKLTGSILNKIQSESPMSQESSMFLLQLVGMNSQSGEDGAEQPGQKTLLSPAQARALLEKVVANAQRELATAKQENDLARAQPAIGQLNNLRPQLAYLEKVSPTTAASLKRSLAQAEQMMGPTQRGWEALDRLAEQGSVEAIVQAAAKAPQDVRQAYYQRASQLAIEKGNFDEAKSLLKTHVQDKNQLRYMMDDIDRQQVYKKINENQFDEARKMAPKFGTTFERVNFLIQLAQNAQNQGKKEIATEILEEAWGLVDGPPETNMQLSSQLQLAGVFASLNPKRSFETLESSIEKINELAAAAAVIESFQEQGGYKKKEMLLLAGGGMAAQYVYQYAQALVSLLSVDVERAHAMIGRFSRPELRVMIQMHLMQQADALMQGMGMSGASFVSGSAEGATPGASLIHGRPHFRRIR